MLDTPLGVLVALFQENRFFWAAEDSDSGEVECQFCLARGNRPETLDHRNGCVILLAMMMIASDEQAVRRIKEAPPRRVLRGRGELTVLRRKRIIDRWRR
jgi:hypothetical protein